MRTYKFTEKDGNIRFHYKFTELREFLTHGFKYGNNGIILTGRINGIDTYKGFGTIENPRKTVYTISVVHNELFDGVQLTPKEIVEYKPSEADSPYTSHRLVFLDFGEE
jgi:hypothetical protein